MSWVKGQINLWVSFFLFFMGVLFSFSFSFFFFFLGVFFLGVSCFYGCPFFFFGIPG